VTRANARIAFLGMSLFAAFPATGCSQAPAPRAEEVVIGRDLANRDTVPRFPARGPGGTAIEGSRRNAIVAAFERAGPAVVSVSVMRRERVVPRTLFERMMLPPGYVQEVPGLGSGFIIHESGLVVTNEHVVRGADQVVVTLPDGREMDATVVGTDELSDLALLRIRLEGGARVPLPMAPLGNSDDLVIGEWVIAIGNPLGFLLANTEPSVTVGVVSAVGRNIIPSGDADEQRGFYLDMIQTDASINPGNSGGPLINALGEVIGVNSSILSQSGGSEGLGFAIPVNRVRQVVQDLVQDGRVRRAWIGAEVEPVPTEGIRRIRDVRVARVVPGSPAESGGLRQGMIIRGMGAKDVRTPLDWQAGLLRARVGEPLEVRVAAGNAIRTLRVIPADLPSLSAERVQALRNLQLVTLTPAIRSERGIASERGALIVAVSEQARAVGLREGDVILQINRFRVQSAEEAARALQAAPGRSFVVYFERNGQLGSTQFVIDG
jgi:serine protease Do